MGLRNIIAKAVANGKKANDRTTKTDVADPKTARKSVLLRLLVLSNLISPAQRTKNIMGKNVKIPL
jgi:hypothetical protein|tara:strand:+ start:338 stop:535 length:198 start_codon:yes stop_codon:yes gene_type:complete